MNMPVPRSFEDRMWEITCGDLMYRPKGQTKDPVPCHKKFIAQSRVQVSTLKMPQEVPVEDISEASKTLTPPDRYEESRDIPPAAGTSLESKLDPGTTHRTI